MQKSLLRAGLMLMFISAGAVHGQLLNQPLPPTGSEQLRSIAGSALLDPIRFSMEHSFSFSVMSGGLGYGVGVYSNRMNYLLSPNITLSSQINLVQPTTNQFPGAAGQGVSLYYRAALNWQISRNVNLSLGLSNTPSYRDYGYGMGRRYQTARALGLSPMER